MRPSSSLRRLRCAVPLLTLLGCSSGSSPRSAEPEVEVDLARARPPVSDEPRESRLVSLDVLLPWQASFRFVQQTRFDSGGMGLVRRVGTPLDEGACMTGNGRVGVVEGDCCVWRVEDEPPPREEPNIGHITVSNLSRTVQSEEVSPWVPWSSGEVVALRAGGGSLPTFEVRAVGPAFPDALSADAQSSLVASHAQGLRRSWTSTASGRMELAVLGPGRVVECRAPAAAGTVAVPGALVRRELGVGTRGVVVLFTWVASESVQEDKGAATLELATQLVDGIDVPVVP